MNNLMKTMWMIKGPFVLSSRMICTHPATKYSKSKVSANSEIPEMNFPFCWPSLKHHVHGSTTMFHHSVHCESTSWIATQPWFGSRQIKGASAEICPGPHQQRCTLDDFRRSPWDLRRISEKNRGVSCENQPEMVDDLSQQSWFIDFPWKI